MGRCQTWLNTDRGPAQTLLFTLTFAVSVRNAPGDLQSVNNIALVNTERVSLEDNLATHHKDTRADIKLIQDRDSGQIEALDRDYVKASSMSQSAPHSPTDVVFVLISFGLIY